MAERELARGPASASETRAWLRSVSTSFGFEATTVEALVLVASELLANAFLHASGPFSVSLEVEVECMRIGVRDRSTTRPVLKAFDDFAATGRGLQIVEASSLAWGVDMHLDGKTVWADLSLPRIDELGDSILQQGDERARRGDAGRRDRPQPSGGASRTSSTGRPEGEAERTAARTGRETGRPHPERVKRVCYRSVPVSEFIAVRARVEAMLRESTLIVLGGARADMPAELLELAERATSQFFAVARAQASASPRPVAEREGVGDFVVEFPIAAVEQLTPFGEVVRTLNEWCMSNHLLVSPLTDEMQRLHDWAIDEALRQIRSGCEPSAFPGSAC